MRPEPGDAGRSRLAEIRIVLDRTSHPGNIGAAARAMKVMGLQVLHLVAPKRFPDAQATAMAANADDLLDRAVVHRSLDEALGDCRYVLGTGMQQRAVEQPMLRPREAADRLLREPGPVAVLFGTENSGLDNASLDRCHGLIRIPTVERYGSLNLAQAVQVICYELHLAAQALDSAVRDHPERMPADLARMEVFFERLEQTLRAIRFSTPGQSETLHRRLRRLFFRARPDDDELNMLNGILSRTLDLAARRGSESSGQAD